MNTAFSIFFNSFLDSEPGHLNPYSNTLFKRFQKVIPEIKWYLLSEAEWLHTKLKIEISELMEIYKISGVNNSKFIEFLTGFYAELIYKEKTINEVYVNHWENESTSIDAMKIPNMLHEESYKYYKWLGKSHKGLGAIVELGPWMGAATYCVMEGLSENYNSDKKEVYVYDSFIWSEDMLMFQVFKDLRNANLRNGDSFLSFFKKYCAKYLDHINISESLLYSDDSIDRTLPELTWNGSKIETIIFDFSSSRVINELTWAKFSPYFISGETTLVFNQFGNLSANQLREFLRDHSGNLKALHKPNSAIKSYQYIN